MRPITRNMPAGIVGPDTEAAYSTTIGAKDLGGWRRQSLLTSGAARAVDLVPCASLTPRSAERNKQMLTGHPRATTFSA